MHINLPCDIFIFKICKFKLPKGDFMLKIQCREKSQIFFKSHRNFVADSQFGNISLWHVWDSQTTLSMHI